MLTFFGKILVHVHSVLFLAGDLCCHHLEFWCCSGIAPSPDFAGDLSLLTGGCVLGILWCILEGNLSLQSRAIKGAAIVASNVPRLLDLASHVASFCS